MLRDRQTKMIKKQKKSSAKNKLLFTELEKMAI
jgi:hypothetical protein